MKEHNDTNNSEFWQHVGFASRPTLSTMPDRDAMRALCESLIDGETYIYTFRTPSKDR